MLVKGYTTSSHNIGNTRSLSGSRRIPHPVLLAHAPRILQKQSIPLFPIHCHIMQKWNNIISLPFRPSQEEVGEEGRRIRRQRGPGKIGQEVRW